MHVVEWLVTSHHLATTRHLRSGQIHGRSGPEGPLMRSIRRRQGAQRAPLGPAAPGPEGGSSVGAFWASLTQPRSPGLGGGASLRSRGRRPCAAMPRPCGASPGGWGQRPRCRGPEGPGPKGLRVTEERIHTSRATKSLKAPMACGLEPRGRAPTIGHTSREAES